MALARPQEGLDSVLPKQRAGSSGTRGGRIRAMGEAPVRPSSVRQSKKHLRAQIAAARCVGAPASDLVSDEGLDVLASDAHGLGRHPALNEKATEEHDRFLIGSAGLRGEVLRLAGEQEGVELGPEVGRHSVQRAVEEGIRVRIGRLNWQGRPCGYSGHARQSPCRPQAMPGSTNDGWIGVLQHVVTSRTVASDGSRGLSVRVGPPVGQRHGQGR